MLSLETCKRLRECGFPQRNCTWYWGVDSAGRAAIFDDGCSRSKYDAEKTQDADWVCPNSDELIAAIRERWPGQIMASDSVTGWLASVDRGGGIDPHAGYIEAEGNSLVEALAELYIALSKEDDNG